MPDQSWPPVGTVWLAVPQPYNEHDHQRNDGHGHNDLDSDTGLTLTLCEGLRMRRYLADSR
jgi:hypothetical protein